MKEKIAELKSEYNQLETQIASLRCLATDKAKLILESVSKEFFKEHSDLVDNIFWTQYTPGSWMVKNVSLV